MAITREELEGRPTWAPQKNDFVGGTLDRITEHSGKTRDGRQFAPYWVAGLDFGQPREVRVWEDGEPAVTEVQYIDVPVRGTVLKNEFERENPEVGDQVGIMYLGERQGATNQYHDWRLVGGRGRTSVAWGRGPTSRRPSSRVAARRPTRPGCSSRCRLASPKPSTPKWWTTKKCRTSRSDGGGQAGTRAEASRSTEHEH